MGCLVRGSEWRECGLGGLGRGRASCIVAGGSADGVVLYALESALALSEENEEINEIRDHRWRVGQREVELGDGV